MKVALDTNCLVALLSEWHEHHRATVAAYEELRRGHHHVIIAVHSLLECFSVLTRLPAAYRIAPRQAEQVLLQNFSRAEVSAVEASLCWSTIHDLSERGLGGGRVYDAVIARSARAAGATVLLTWNVRDFLSVVPPGLEIREPGG